MDTSSGWRGTCANTATFGGRMPHARVGLSVMQHAKPRRASTLVVERLRKRIAELESAVRDSRGSDALSRAEEALRRSQDLLTDELLAARQLQETSTQTTATGDDGSLFERIIDAAVVIMRADFASLQMLDPDAEELRLLAFRGFTLAAATRGEVAALDEDATLRAALRTAS